MTEQLIMIPQPKQAVLCEGSLSLDGDTVIQLHPEAPSQVFWKARSLQQELLDATGLKATIQKSTLSVTAPKVIRLFSDIEAARSYWGELPIDIGGLEAHGAQAYVVIVDDQGVWAGGQGLEALHYAVQTLRQFARAYATTWPACQVLDWPSLAYRGVMFDVSRGKVPTLDTLKLLVDQLSLYKANVLQLYTEHTFCFPHHPRIGMNCGSLSTEDICELDEYASARYVELIPNLNSFGHCAHLLHLPEYAHLAESPALWSLCPVDEAVYDLLDELYDDLLPAFRSSMFNVGCDETWDLGKGRSADAVARTGAGRVYLNHLLRLYELGKKHGRRIQIWGDILLHYPELVSELPDDVILLDWHYEAAEDYPSVNVFSESGREFWVCPGTSSWNTLFPRIENSNGNVCTLARVGVEQGASGMLNTDWGDSGHYQPIGQCWYGYLYGAEQAWSGGQTEDGDFDAHLGRLFFGNGGDVVVRTMRTIGKLNTLPGMARSNATNSIYALLDEPLLGQVTDQIPAATLQTIQSACRVAQHDLAQVMDECSDRPSVEEISWSLRMMVFAARKTLACQALRRDLAQVVQGPQSALGLLPAHIGILRALEHDLNPLVEEFRQQWLRRARWSEIRISLGHMSKLANRLAKAADWLESGLVQERIGEAVDWSLESYQSKTEVYEVLGQGFWRRMQELGV